MAAFSTALKFISISIRKIKLKNGETKKNLSNKRKTSLNQQHFFFFENVQKSVQYTCIKLIFDSFTTLFLLHVYVYMYVMTEGETVIY